MYYLFYCQLAQDLGEVYGPSALYTTKEKCVTEGLKATDFEAQISKHEINSLLKKWKGKEYMYETEQMIVRFVSIDIDS